ncbi:MAG TPA: YdcF family protein [Candidatus Dormibacteraeota bacterium]|nr:YdcF family protein [Candidatus Dormibacteraeota bacterium]
MGNALIATLLPTEPARKPRLWPLLALGLISACLFVFFHLGRWLIVEDPLQNAAAIAVLSGRMPNRALEAAKVYKQGYAPQVWLTHSTEPGATLAKLSVPYQGEDVYDKLILIHEGVPESAISVLDPPIVNTADEMAAIGQALQRANPRRVILVTSKVHTRRTHTLWKRLSTANGEAIVHGVSDDPFDADHWWQNTSDALDVVREVLGLLNAWAGLPLRPAA